MHRHEMQQLNIYLIYEFIEFYSFQKIGCYNTETHLMLLHLFGEFIYWCI
jgi:hypothetical protein